MDLNLNDHKKLMDGVYKNPKFPEAIDIWTSYIASNKDMIVYSNWRYLNAKRQNIENKVFRKFIKSKNKILDIGCGKGFFIKRIYHNFKDTIKYYGVDISEVAINLAKNYFPKAKYKTVVGEDLPFENNFFDYIQIIATLEHVLNPKKIIKEAYRVLKKGGYLYIVIHKKAWDPLIISTIYNKHFAYKRGTKEKIDPLHPLTLQNMRNELDLASKQLNLLLIEKRSLVSHINLNFYQKLKIPFRLLLLIVKIANMIPISIFKNLEYYIYKK